MTDVLRINAAVDALRAAARERDRGHFRTPEAHFCCAGTKYGPLQTDGFSFLCPDCGGYGMVPGKAGSTVGCKFCGADGVIALDDARVSLERAA